MQIADLKSPRMSSRVIVVTGANGGLGQAIARAFLAESPENFVWLGVRQNRARADRLTEAFPGRCKCLELDVTQAAAWQKAVADAVAEHKNVVLAEALNAAPGDAHPSVHIRSFPFKDPAPAPGGLINLSADADGADFHGDRL